MVLIIADTAEQARDYARRLLDAAQDKSLVRTATGDLAGGVVAFDVPDALATAAGFPLDDDTEPAPAPVEEPAPARNASRAQWVAFLLAQDPPVAHTAGDSRDELVALWDSQNKTT